MKKLISLIILAVLLFCGCRVDAYAGILTLPARLCVIEDYAFAYDNAITEVRIPEGVVSIGAYAFAYCGLQRIVIPDSVTSISPSAFAGINGLTIVASYGSCAFDYAFQDSRFTWENSRRVSTVTYDSPLTRENVLRLLDDIDPDGAFLIRNSEDHLSDWFGSATTIGEGIDRLETAVHEQCHYFTHAVSQYRYNRIQGNNMRAKERFYVGNGQVIEVPTTDVFPTSEMADTIPESLRSYRFGTYIDGDPAQSANKYGVYGLMNEFNAYCWGNACEIRQKEFKLENEQNRGITRYSGNYFSYAEFRYWILHYMLYARDHYPSVYQGIMNNGKFRQAFTIIDDFFAGFAEQGKSSFYLNTWNTLMEEMRKPAYVEMADLLKN